MLGERCSVGGTGAQQRLTCEVDSGGILVLDVIEHAMGGIESVRMTDNGGSESEDDGMAEGISALWRSSISFFDNTLPGTTIGGFK